MPGKGSRKRYQEKRGYIIPNPTSFSKSEEGSRYQYDTRIANKFAGWSTKQRDAGLTPTFKNFYNELPDEDKKTITVTEVFKSTE
jgi:hypothetical protein